MFVVIKCIFDEQRQVSGLEGLLLILKRKLQYFTELSKDLTKKRYLYILTLLLDIYSKSQKKSQECLPDRAENPK
jgi:hypothetical protein